MRSSIALASLAAGLVAAQDSTVVVVTDGVTASYTLPAWLSGTPPPGVPMPTVPTELNTVTITVSPLPSAGTAGQGTTLTVVPSAIPSGSTWGPPPFGQSSSSASNALGTGSTRTSRPSTWPTGNATVTAPTTIATAAGDRLSGPGMRAVGGLAAAIAGLFML